MVKTLLRLSLLVLLSSTSILAQTPAWEFFAGYSVERSDVREYYKSTPTIYTFRDRYIHLNGWEGSITENLNNWFGGTLQLTGHYKTPVVAGSTNNEKMFSILYGPRFSHRMAWVTPFAHVLFGAAQVSVRVTPTGPHASETAFAAAAGAGFDLNLGSKAAIRVLQVQYSPMNQVAAKNDKIQASAGVVVHLGKTK